MQKEAQMFGNFLGFLKTTFPTKAVATFWATFWKTWATFYSNIWSNWLYATNGKTWLDQKQVNRPDLHIYHKRF